MNTKTKSKQNTSASAVTLPEGTLSIGASDQIDFSPFNYRKKIDENKLNQFAEELAQHGIISPLTVRPGKQGRYELVAGERRLKAASIAKLKQVPVCIRELTDEQVIEIQLSENMQRENPHPFHEAQGIALMQQAGKKMEEMALRLGKSKQYIYSRLKLLSLVKPFQEMFLSDAISIGEAYELATLSPKSQQELFDDECTGWKEQEYFHLPDLDDTLRRYKYELAKAPFDTTNPTLGLGSCEKCHFNSSTLLNLFAGIDERSICSNKQCFQSKCTQHFSNSIQQKIGEERPAGLLFIGQPSPTLESILEQIPETTDLQRFNVYETDILELPEMPDKADYLKEETETDEGDTEAFEQAMEEYNLDMEEYQQLAQSGKFQKGLQVSNKAVEGVYVTLEKSNPRQAEKKVTAKLVQEAIKTKTATKELLSAEIERLKSREARALELYREKVQLQVHEAFQKSLDEHNTEVSLTEADQAAVKWLLFQSLDWGSKNDMPKLLFKKQEPEKHDKLYQQVTAMPDHLFAALIRRTLAGKAECKYPRSPEAFFLRQVALAAGLDIAHIEKAQQEKATARKSKSKERINGLQKQIKQIKST